MGPYSDSGGDVVRWKNTELSVLTTSGHSKKAAILKPERKLSPGTKFAST